MNGENLGSSKIVRCHHRDVSADLCDCYIMLTGSSISCIANLDFAHTRLTLTTILKALLYIRHGPLILSSCANCELPCKCPGSSPPLLDVYPVWVLECSGDSVRCLGGFDEHHPRGKLDHLV